MALCMVRHGCEEGTFNIPKRWIDEIVDAFQAHVLRYYAIGFIEVEQYYSN